jgi:hypothetical protein
MLVAQSLKLVLGEGQMLAIQSLVKLEQTWWLEFAEVSVVAAVSALWLLFPRCGCCCRVAVAVLKVILK